MINANNLGVIRWLRAYFFSLLIGAIAMALTLVAWAATRNSLEIYDTTRFATDSKTISDDISFRMQTYINALVQMKGIFAVTGEISRQEFSMYVKSMEILTQYPGIQGLGYTARIPRQDLDEHVRKMHEDGFTSYHIWPDAERRDRFAVLYLEPLDWRNRRTLGFDMFSEPIRRQAMEKARDTGRPATTGRVVLVQETDVSPQAGFLIYVPVYYGGKVPETVEERRRLLRGFIYSPFRAKDLFTKIFASVSAQDRIDFEVFDGPDPLAGSSLYSRAAALHLPPAEPNPHFQKRVKLDVGGRVWTVDIKTLPGFELKSSRLIPDAVLVIGGLISFLMFWIVRNNTRHAEQEEMRARELETINRVGRTLSATLDLERLLQSVTDAATQLTQAEWGAFFYREEQSGTEAFHLQSTSGVAREDWSESLPARSELRVQVTSRGGERSGVLVFGHSKAGVFNERERRIVEGLAAQAAVAIDNARLYQSAQEAISARDEFLSIASHELKTPLTPLKLQLQGLRRAIIGKKQGGLDPRQLIKIAEMSDKQITRMVNLVENLLDISRITSGRLRLELEETDIVSLAREVVDRFRPQLNEAGCHVEFIAPAHLFGCIDRVRIDQVIANLLTNAAKYGGGKPITVSVEGDGARARILVRDRGMGISPDDHGKIFERFERLQQGREISGLGLGLYISRQIIEAHEGAIRVESSIGTGSTFIIELPLDLRSEARSA